MPISTGSASSRPIPSRPIASRSATWAPAGSPPPRGRRDPARGRRVPASAASPRGEDPRLGDLGAAGLEAAVLSACSFGLPQRCRNRAPCIVPRLPQGSDFAAGAVSQRRVALRHSPFAFEGARGLTGAYFGARNLAAPTALTRGLTERDAHVKTRESSRRLSLDPSRRTLAFDSSSARAIGDGEIQPSERSPVILEGDDRPVRDRTDIIAVVSESVPFSRSAVVGFSACARFTRKRRRAST